VLIRSGEVLELIAVQDEARTDKHGRRRKVMIVKLEKSGESKQQSESVKKTDQ